jgi:hypothetical protein
MIVEVTKMAAQGMTDKEIGAAIGKSDQAVRYLYRKRYGIQAGRYNRKALPKKSQKEAFKPKPLDQLYV